MLTDRRIQGRFWPKVAAVGNVCECWEWTAAKLKSGYGVLGVGGRTACAHRIAYEISIGPIPDGLEIDHLCSNRSCVNPWHLEPVTHQENQRRGLAGETMAQIHRNKTHCPSGHPYDAENTRIYKGFRNCRACGRLHSKRWKDKQ